MNDQQSCEAHDIGPTTKTGFKQITVTVDDQVAASQLIKVLTKMKLIACAQIQGQESKIIGNGHWRCRFKTSDLLYDKVCIEVDQFFGNKIYDLQSSSIVKGSKHFLNWLKAELIS